MMFGGIESMVRTRRGEVPRFGEGASDAHSIHLSDRTPPARTDPEDSTFSVASAAVIAELREQLLDERNQRQEMSAQLGELRAAMRAAGVLRSQTVDRSGDEEERLNDEGGPMVQNPRGSTYKMFLSCKPPTFKGGDDPLVCMRWIRKMEQTFATGNYNESQKVNFAVCMLEGEALEWWDSIQQGITAGIRRNLTWAIFVEKVNMRYCNQGAIQRNEREFLHLKKGSMSIAKYCIAFTEKLQFARHFCPDQRSMIARFVEGLPFPYKAAVRHQATLDLAMEEARRIEDDLNERDDAKIVGEKRKGEGPSGPSKKGKVESKRGERGDKAVFCRPCNSTHEGPCGKETVRCKRCGKLGHVIQDCRSKEPMCYNCKEMGHISTQCTKPKGWNSRDAGKKVEVPKAMGRAYHMVAGEQ